MGEHWYDRSGKPAYSTNGRDTTLRDARKLGYVPSVTTVTSVMAKAALTDWMVKQGILAALTLPRLDGEGDDAFIARVLEDSRQQAKAAAEEGSRIHDACEKLVKGEPFDPKYDAHAQAAVAELHRLFPDVTDWVAEKSFAHPLGFGGKVDLHSPSSGIVADYKTKDGDFSDGKRLHYDQNIQLAAYQVGLGLAWTAIEDKYARTFGKPFVFCANIFVSRTHPGAVASHVWSADDIADGWRTFAAALELWKIVKGYNGSY
jgi:hypothetical protein